VESTQRLGIKRLDARIARLDLHILECESLFREALDAARRALEAARDGDPIRPVVAPASGTAPARREWPEPGDSAADFRAGTFHLASKRGKPVVLVLLKPGGETTAPALRVAEALAKRYPGRVEVAPLVAFGDVVEAERERDRLKLTVPLFAGASAAILYGVETVPRFAVIDPAGRVQWTFTGVGAETGFLLKEELDRLVPPATPAAQRGITAPPGPIGVPLVPPP
jgi:hypothetical protein